MIRGVTKTGFEFEVDEKAADNMELVDALAGVEENDPLALSRACLLLLGKTLRGRLYDHVRDENGRVPIEAASQELVDILGAFGQQGKN